MNEFVCSFFAGSVAEWAGVVATAGTGVAVAILAYKANQFAMISKIAADKEREQTAKSFAHLIGQEVAVAESKLRSYRRQITQVLSLRDIQQVEEIDRFAKILDKPQLQQTEFAPERIGLLPSEVSILLNRGLGSLGNSRTLLQQALTQTDSVGRVTVFTEVGIQAVEAAMPTLRSAEQYFRGAHIALWKYMYPGTDIPLYQPNDGLDG